MALLVTLRERRILRRCELLLFEKKNIPALRATTLRERRIFPLNESLLAKQGNLCSTSHGTPGSPRSPSFRITLGGKNFLLCEALFFEKEKTTTRRLIPQAGKALLQEELLSELYPTMYNSSTCHTSSFTWRLTTAPRAIL